MKDLTKYYIDLSKCTEEQIKSLPLILGNESIYFHDKRLFKKGKYNLDYPLFYFSFSNQWIGGDKRTNQKRSELTYPEFIKIFEGGEDNNGWIKIESEADLPKEGMMNYFICIDSKPSIHPTNLRLLLSLYNDGMVSHYQKIHLPKPPKF